MRAHYSRTGKFYCWGLRGLGDVPAELRIALPQNEEGFWETLCIEPLHEPMAGGRWVRMAWADTLQAFTITIPFRWTMDEMVRQMLKRRIDK